MRTKENSKWLLRAVAITAVVLAAGLHQAGSVARAQAPTGQGFNLNASDLRFIMKQIRISERHAATATASNPCGTLLGSDADQIPTGTGQTIELPWGLRTVDGSCNHLTPGQETFGTADQMFPRLLSKELRDAEGIPAGLPPLFGAPGTPTSYTQTTGRVFDSQPRIISNLIVDQTPNNPAAVAAAGENAELTPSGDFFIPNIAPDVGLSAPFNSWFTLFGQFFDHGLDLVNKGGNGFVYIPLQPDDPLYAEAIAAGVPPFMIMSRATHSGDHEAINQTSPWIDQSQTYTSHSSHQVFLREYVLDGGEPVGTGSLISGPGHSMARWMDVKAQARTVLGIELSDTDALSVPLMATDAYGRFIRGPNGFPQMIKVDGNVLSLVEGNLGSPVDTVNAVPTGHAFLDDIAHLAAPGGGKTPDADDEIGNDDSDPTTYDNELLDAHFMAGDGRVNENIGLIAVHHVFHAEHNRLVGVIAGMIASDPAFTQAERDAWHATDHFGFGTQQSWDYAERLFQAARFVTEMEYQHLAFEEFARKVQPMINPFGEGGTGFNATVNGAIRAEFAHAVYRFGHSMLTESVDRISADGTDYSVSLMEAFLNPPRFFDGLDPETDPQAGTKAAGAIIRGMTSQIGNEIDEFVVEALRNRLLGLPLDLAAINMARARDTGIPRLNEARRQFYASTQNSSLAPYSDWASFGFSIRHPSSLVNFVAAYGTHPSITSATGVEAKRAAALALVEGVTGEDGPPVPEDAFDFLDGTGGWASPPGGRTTTGVDDIDLWVGGLAEKQVVFGGLLGPTFNHVFEAQMEDLQDGDRFYYLSRTAGLNLLVQLEGNSFAELISRNTDAHGLPADVFSRPAFVFHLSAQTNPFGIVDDPATGDYDERELLIRMADGTIRYTGPEHVVFNGSPGNDRIWSSEGDDTLRGNDGNDWLNGGDGNDHLIGGDGDDILFGGDGDDVLKGGDGNDALSSGQGFGGDLNQGGRGNDFIVGGNDATVSFGGPGNDFIYGGDGDDTVFGDDGDDWIEGGRGAFNLLQGDNGAPFQDDQNEAGHDVLMGYGGETDYDAEGGDDIMFMGPGIQRAEGMLGFDWAIHRSDPNPADSDMLFTLAQAPSPVVTNRDRFDRTEGLSGWIRDDILRGDNRSILDTALESTFSGHELLRSGVIRIAGLDAIVPLPIGPGDPVAFTGGNILLGGAGSDILEGRGGNDILDGDRWLDAQIRVMGVRPPGVAEYHDSMATLSAAVFAGQINPGNLEIVRSIKIAAANPLDIDIAVFSGPRDDYDIVPNANGSVTVTHARGTAIDGTDTLWNIEVLQFSDQPMSIAGEGQFMLVRSPIADTYVQGGNQNVNLNFGMGTSLRSQQQGAATSVSRSYLKFEIPAIPLNMLVDSVKLRLYVTDASPNNQTVFLAGNGWTEESLTFNNAAIQAPRSIQLASQPVPIGLNFVEFTLPVAAVLSPNESGTIVSFEITGGADLAVFNSREAAANRPQLIITLGGEAAVAPGAPTGVIATAGNASATVSWTAPANDGGSPITSYIVTASPGSATATTTGLSLTISGLVNGTSYTFRVAAVNEVGTGLLSVPSNPVTPALIPIPIVFAPEADAYVRSGGQATRNFGTATTLQTRESGANNTFRTYLRFNITGLSGGASTATLRLFVTDTSINLHTVRTFTGAWTETGITFNNAQALTLGGTVANLTPNAAGYIDIPLAITPANGLINLQIQSSGADAAIFHSREAANSPQLVITQGP
jgi:Ca2+-binding RTX toxin-like protein